jgi:hypothetical protein
MGKDDQDVAAMQVLPVEKDGRVALDGLEEEHLRYAAGAEHVDPEKARVDEWVESHEAPVAREELECREHRVSAAKQVHEPTGGGRASHDSRDLVDLLGFLLGGLLEQARYGLEIFGALLTVSPRSPADSSFGGSRSAAGSPVCLRVGCTNTIPLQIADFVTLRLCGGGRIYAPHGLSRGKVEARRFWDMNTPVKPDA